MNTEKIKQKIREEYPGLKISIVDEIVEEAERKVEQDDNQRKD